MYISSIQSKHINYDCNVRLLCVIIVLSCSIVSRYIRIFDFVSIDIINIDTPNNINMYRIPVGHVTYCKHW